MMHEASASHVSGSSGSSGFLTLEGQLLDGSSSSTAADDLLVQGSGGGGGHSGGCGGGSVVVGGVLVPNGLVSSMKERLLVRCGPLAGTAPAGPIGIECLQQAAAMVARLV